MDVESLERQESMISTNETFILNRLKDVEKSPEEIIKAHTETLYPTVYFCNGYFAFNNLCLSSRRPRTALFLVSHDILFWIFLTNTKDGKVTVLFFVPQSHYRLPQWSLMSHNPSLRQPTKTLNQTLQERVRSFLLIPVKHIVLCSSWSSDIQGFTS